jgi:hypothetical protein
MIRYFIIQYIDAIITTGGGLLATFYAYQAAAKGDVTQRIRLLKVLGPCLIGFGLLRFATDSVSQAEWRRVETADGVASVEFPAAPSPNDQTQTLQGQTVHTMGWAYTIAAKDISLHLSYSDVPGEETKVPDAERFNFSKQYFTGQGFRIVAEGTGTFGSAPGYFMQLEQGDGKTVSWIRVAYVGTRVYRVVATAGQPFREEALIPKFLESFRIQPATVPASR